MPRGPARIQLFIFHLQLGMWPFFISAFPFHSLPFLSCSIFTLIWQSKAQKAGDGKPRSCGQYRRKRKVVTDPCPVHGRRLWKRGWRAEDFLGTVHWCMSAAPLDWVADRHALASGENKTQVLLLQNKFMFAFSYFYSVTVPIPFIQMTYPVSQGKHHLLVMFNGAWSTDSNDLPCKPWTSLSSCVQWSMIYRHKWLTL